MGAGYRTAAPHSSGLPPTARFMLCPSGQAHKLNREEPFDQPACPATLLTAVQERAGCNPLIRAGLSCLLSVQYSCLQQNQRPHKRPAQNFLHFILTAAARREQSSAWAFCARSLPGDAASPARASFSLSLLCMPKKPQEAALTSPISIYQDEVILKGLSE